MQSRKEFLKQSGILTTGALLFNTNDLFAGAKPKNSGLQLFTLFNVFDEDVKGNLQKVAGIGYKEIESAFSRKGAYYGMTAIEFAALLKELRLSWQSHHVPGNAFKPRPGMDASKMPKALNLTDNGQQAVDEIAAAGVPYLVCSSIAIETADQIKMSAEVLQITAEIAQKAALKFCYHNHDKEFAETGGIRAFDYFASQISSDLLKFELDIAWATKGGEASVALFKKYPKRFPLWHIKDIDAAFKTILPVGEGIIDYKRIFNHSGKAGLQHFFIEHDMPKDPFGSIGKSIVAVKKFL